VQSAIRDQWVAPKLASLQVSHTRDRSKTVPRSAGHCCRWATYKVSTSYATADKSLRRAGRIIATTLRDQWVAPKLASLHWDSKLMQTLSNKNTLHSSCNATCDDHERMSLFDSRVFSYLKRDIIEGIKTLFLNSHVLKYHISEMTI